MLKTKLFAPLIPFLLFGCTVTGPADDGYERDNEWVDNGRLLSSDNKTLYSSEDKSGSKTLLQRITGANTDKAVDNNPEQDSSNYAEFEQFKEWQKLKSGTASSSDAKQYEEFRQWQEFQKMKAAQ